MIRYIVILLTLAVAALFTAPDAHAIVGVSVKLGAGVIRDNGVPGGMAAVELGPLNPFVEVFRKSGTTSSTWGETWSSSCPSPWSNPTEAPGAGSAGSPAGGPPSLTVCSTWWSART